jgi:hypothetical protein
MSLRTLRRRDPMILEAAGAMHRSTTRASTLLGRSDANTSSGSELRAMVVGHTVSTTAERSD